MASSVYHESARRMVPVPTVGRSVHYVSRGSRDGKFPSVCWAAVVTELPLLGPDHDEAAELVVTLCVLNPNGILFDHLVCFDDGQGPGTWHWPEGTREATSNGQ